MKAEERAIVCLDCDDSGWLRLECTGDRACGRRLTHRPHPYVEECPCRPLNRNFQDKQQRSGRQAA